MRLCEIPGCTKKHMAKGWCSTHHQRWLRHGDPLYGVPKLSNGEAWAYFLEHRDYSGTECVIWPYSLNHRGYGQIRPPGASVPVGVHVLSCIHRWGPRPTGLIVLHGPCHQPACFNGNHLSWGTYKQNVADMFRDGTSLKGRKRSW